jgi:hypothetical protein
MTTEPFPLGDRLYLPVETNASYRTEANRWVNYGLALHLGGRVFLVPGRRESGNRTGVGEGWEAHLISLSFAQKR